MNHMHTLTHTPAQTRAGTHCHPQSQLVNFTFHKGVKLCITSTLLRLADKADTEVNHHKSLCRMLYVTRVCLMSCIHACGLMNTEP